MATSNAPLTPERAEKLETRLGWLDDALARLRRDFDRAPRIGWLALLAVPAALIWTWLAAVIVVFTVVMLVGVTLYVAWIHINEYETERGYVLEQLGRRASKKELDPMTTLHDFTMRGIDGKDVSLADFKGKAVLLVNVASRCGKTPQYKGLQALYEEFKDRGLVIAGFPANDFGRQEPGTDAEILTFCSTNYDVTFPMFSKITVKGDAKHPLYQWLTESADPKGAVQWNFEKFLVGRDGRVVGRFRSGVDPEDKDLRDAVARALG